METPRFSFIIKQLFMTHLLICWPHSPTSPQILLVWDLLGSHQQLRAYPSNVSQAKHTLPLKCILCQACQLWRALWVITVSKYQKHVGLCFRGSGGWPIAPWACREHGHGKSLWLKRAGSWRTRSLGKGMLALSWLDPLFFCSLSELMSMSWHCPHSKWVFLSVDVRTNPLGASQFHM